MFLFITDSMLIRKSSLSDSAEYSCIASNTVGYAKEDVVVKVSDKRKNLMQN